MHVGKEYPYLPIYWATECFFWPGFCPWKWYVRWDTALPPPWDVAGFPFAQFSSEGGVVLDRTQAFWECTVDTDLLRYILRISQELIVRDGKQWARSKLKLSEDAGPEVADAWLYQPFPQYAQDLWGKGWSLVDDPYDTGTKLYVNLRPAVYSEVGSPFPNY